jgi:TetR/AcrR family transcriptional regulator, repressor for uid operon
LLMVLCGVGFYAGYLRTHHEMDAVTHSLQQLLAGQLWRRDA